MSNSKLSNARLTSTRKRVTNILVNAPQASDGVSSNMDPAIHGNTKALEKLINHNWDGLPTVLNFSTFQVYVSQHQRDAEVRWILEMCDELCCDKLVFSLAAAYFDRYLCTKTAEFQELRYISAACIFLAAKMKMANPPKYDAVQANFPYLTTKKLFDYELAVTQSIKWNFALPTPYDFYDHFLAFSPYFVMLQESFDRAVRTLYCDFDLACYDPQVQALGALYFSITTDTNFTNWLPQWSSYFHRFHYSIDSLKHIYDSLYMKQGVHSATTTATPQTYFSNYLYVDYNPFVNAIWNGSVWDNTTTA